MRHMHALVWRTHFGGIMGMLQEEQLWRDNAVLRNENKALAERLERAEALLSRTVDALKGEHDLELLKDICLYFQEVKP